MLEIRSMFPFRMYILSYIDMIHFMEAVNLLQYSVGFGTQSKSEMHQSSGHLN